MPITPQEFVAKWEKVDLKERSFYQEHFLDLCRLVGHDSPAIDDPTGKNFSFEAGAGRGFADVLSVVILRGNTRGNIKILTELMTSFCAIVKTCKTRRC